MTPCQIFLILAAVSQVDSHNYLVYSPIFAHSHANYLGKLADTLTDAGHNVTLLAPLVNYRLRGKFNVQSTKDVITHDVDQKMINLQNKIDKTDIGNFWTEYATVFSQGKMIESFMALFTHDCELVTLNEEMKSELKKRKFDVIIFEPFNICAHLLRDYLKIDSFIIASSLPIDEIASKFIGEPFPTSSVPILMSTQSNKMDLFGRARNAFEHYWPNNGDWYEVPTYLFDNIGIKPFLAKERLKDCAFYFSNSNPFIDFPRPTLPKTIPIGGIVVDAKKLRSQKVDAEFDEVLNRRDKTVLMSFGTVILSSFMPDNYRNNLLKVFASMPDVTFIWKYETDDLDWASGATNVHFAKWVPQAALLADTRLTAFITHGGLGSTTELAYFGKPALMVPMFADQMRNAKMLERHGGAKVISKTQLGDFDAIKDALRDILYEESYRINAETLAKQLEHQPISPRETVVKHAEFAAMFKDMSALDFAGTELSFVQYYLLDVLFIVVSISVVLSTAAFQVLCTLFGFFWVEKMKTN